MGRFKSSYPEHRLYEDAVTLHALADITVSANGTIEAELPDCKAIVFAAFISPASLVGDTIDLYIQTYLPDGSINNWVDVVHFTQIVGNAGAPAEMVAKISADAAEAEFNILTALGAAAVRNIFGSKWRIRSVVADGGGTHTFTTSVVAYPIGR